MRVRVWSAAATLSSPLVVQVTQERSHLAFQLPLTLRDQYAAYFQFPPRISHAKHTRTAAEVRVLCRTLPRSVRVNATRSDTQSSRRLAPPSLFTLHSASVAVAVGPRRAGGRGQSPINVVNVVKVGERSSEGLRIVSVNRRC